MKNTRTLLLLVCSFVSLWASAQVVPHRVVIKPANGYTGVTYTVTLPRNLALYPYTEDGFKRLSNAVKRGMLNLTVESSGCVIRAGTVPPLTPPSCNVATTPPTTGGGTSVTYHPISKVLIEANSIGFYPVNPGFGWYGNWGAAASAANKDFFHILSDSIHTIYPQADVRLWGQHNEQGISIAEGGYFEQEYDRLSDGLHRYDTLSQYAPDYLIVRLGENVTEVRSTFQTSWKNQIDRVTIHNPNAKKLITTSGWGNNDVDNALTLLAANNNWPLVDLRGIPGSRDGSVNHPNDSWHLTAANRIWAKMKASVTITASTTTTPPASGNVDSQGFLVYQDQGWSGADEKVITGNGMEMRFKRSVGACPTWLSLQSNGRNVINDAQVGPQGAKFSDKGVQVQLSWYSHPAGGQPYTTDGRTIGGTGANPVQGGNTNPYFVASPIEKSAIINDPVRGQVFCSRTRSLLWDWPNTAGHGTVDLEYWTQPNKVVAYKARVNVEERPSGTPEQRKWTALSQEFLCFYGIASYNNHIVDINGSEYNMRNGIPLNSQSNDWFTSGCYIGIYAGDRSQGLMYYTPRNAIFKSWQKTSEQGEWADDVSAYVNASSKWNLDITGHYVDNGYFILGSKAEALAAKAQLEPIDQTFDFDFTNTNNTWWNEDARLMRESNGLLKWYVGDVNHDNASINTGKMLSPVRAWQASNFNNIEFTMAVSGTTQLNLKWGKPGQFGQVEFRTPITVTGDGTERTYQFNLSNLQNWNGTISYIGLEANLNTNNPNAYILLRRARKF